MGNKEILENFIFDCDCGMILWDNNKETYINHDTFYKLININDIIHIEIIEEDILEIIYKTHKKAILSAV